MSELSSNLQNYDFGLCLRQEFFDVVEDHVDAVSDEDAVADAAVFLDANIQEAGAEGELAVDGEGLALSERARDQWDADFVCGGVVCSWPHDLVDAEFLGIQTRHPVFSVGGAVFGAGVLFAGGFKIAQSFLLGVDCLSSFHLFRDLGTHRGEQLR